MSLNDFNQAELLEGKKMAVLEQRQKSMEAKFAREAELEFLVRVRAFRALATWGASLKGTPFDETEDLVQALIRADLRSPGDDGAIAVLQEHLGELVEEALLRRKLDAFTEEARAAAYSDRAG